MRNGILATMSSDDAVVEQARVARDAGAAWRARDLLTAHVEAERDPEALSLLGEVLHEMGDLPRAGAIWFAAGAKGPEVDVAVAAWREQTHDDFGQMWRSLPASVRAEPRPRRLEALRQRAQAVEAASGEPGEAGEPDEPGEPGETTSGGERNETASGHAPEPPDDDEGFDASWLVAWVLAVAFVVFAVIGFVTALGWIVPG